MSETLAPVRPSRTATDRLPVLADLFDRLHAENIRYCQWKSNEHLPASLAGKTDFDMLVHRADAGRLARVLDEADFNPFRELTGQAYPGIEDYLGHDMESGRLTHFHIHYQLTLGEKFLKGYRLPWEHVGLATRVWDAEHGLYVLDPHLETLVLVTRAALKLRVRDYLLKAAGYAYVRGDTARELRWLASRIDQDRLRTVAEPLVGAHATALLREMLAAPAPTIRQLLAFRRSIRPSLHFYRAYGAWEARARRWGRESGWAWVALRNRLRGLHKRSTRTATQGGLALAVAGPQPHATALAQALIAWLSPEMAVVPDVGGGSSHRARRARVLGMITVADRRRVEPAADQPELVITLSEASGGTRALPPQAPQAPAVVEIDAGQPPAAILLHAKRAVWDAIRGRA